MTVRVKVLSYRVIVTCTYPWQVEQVTLVQSVPGFSNIYILITALAKHGIYNVCWLARYFIAHFVCYALCASEGVGGHDIWTDSAPLCSTRSTRVTLIEKLSVLLVDQDVLNVAVSSERDQRHFREHLLHLVGSVKRRKMSAKYTPTFGSAVENVRTRGTLVVWRPFFHQWSYYHLPPDIMVLPPAHSAYCACVISQNVHSRDVRKYTFLLYCSHGPENTASCNVPQNHV